MNLGLSSRTMASFTLIAGLSVLLGTGCAKHGSQPEKTQGRSASDSTSALARGDGGTRIQSVGDGSRPAVRRLSSVDHRVIDVMSQFALALNATVSRSNEGANTLVSPLATEIGLAVLQRGARGATRDAIEKVSGLADLTPAKTRRALMDLRASLRSASDSVALDLVNSMWVFPGPPLAPSFADAAEELRVHVEDINPAGGPPEERINAWVRESTDGRISDIVDRVAPETSLLLVDAMHFRASWEQKFSAGATIDAPFHTPSGPKPVRMMNRDGSFRSMDEGGVVGVRLPYAGGRFAMYVFLPKNEKGLPGVLAALDFRQWNRWMGAFAERQGHVRIPRFQVTSDLSLAAALRALGMGVAFEPRRADFGDIRQGAGAGLFVSNVAQKVIIDVTEEGSDVAAATITGIELGAHRVTKDAFDFNADHPFLFVIRDDLTAAVIALGTVYDPGDAR